MMSDVAPTPNASPAADLQIPMADIVRFVRQLSHDLRNHLNAAELQSAFLSEIAGDGEVKDEVKRLRSMLAAMGSDLQGLSSALTSVRLSEMPYEAAAFAEDLRAKFEQRSPERAGDLEWVVNCGDAVVQIDPQILQQAMLHLIDNAFQHGRGEGAIQLAAEVRDGAFTMQLREPKSSFDADTENWGREPFRKVKHGHYGLGLPRVRNIVEAHGGTLRAHFDREGSSLVTTVSLPLATAT